MVAETVIDAISFMFEGDTPHAPLNQNIFAIYTHIFFYKFKKSKVLLFNIQIEIILSFQNTLFFCLYINQILQ